MWMTRRRDAPTFDDAEQGGDLLGGAADGCGTSWAPGRDKSEI
jgi:hypothetical protein